MKTYHAGLATPLLPGVEHSISSAHFQFDFDLALWKRVARFAYGSGVILLPKKPCRFLHLRGTSL